MAPLGQGIPRARVASRGLLKAFLGTAAGLSSVGPGTALGTRNRPRILGKKRLEKRDAWE